MSESVIRNSDTPWLYQNILYLLHAFTINRFTVLTLRDLQLTRALELDTLQSLTESLDGCLTRLVARAQGGAAVASTSGGGGFYSMIYAGNPQQVTVTEGRGGGGGFTVSKTVTAVARTSESHLYHELELSLAG